MSEHETQKTATKVAKPPVGLSDKDHTAMLDLLLQQVAARGREGAGKHDPKAAIASVQRVLEAIKDLEATFQVPDSEIKIAAVLRSVDAAFLGIDELHDALVAAGSPAAQFASALKQATDTLHKRFTSLGWKQPTSNGDKRLRDGKAEAANLLKLSPAERAKLGAMYMRAARQHILADWEDVVDNKPARAIAGAASNLLEATQILSDPNLAEESTLLSAEVDATDLVLGRLFSHLEEHSPNATGQLSALAKQADALREIAGHKPKWTPRISGSKPVAQDKT